LQTPNFPSFFPDQKSPSRTEKNGIFLAHGWAWINRLPRGKTMGWKFWQKSNAKTGGEKAKKLPRPKELPSGVGRFLVVDLGLEPDWVWNLKGVSAPREDDRNRLDIRIFDEAQAAGRSVYVKSYKTLDDHPELILFQGWYDKGDWKMDIRDLRKIQEAAA
jgi:hypothetical protein